MGNIPYAASIKKLGATPVGFFSAGLQGEILGNSRSVMLLDVLGDTRTTIFLTWTDRLRYVIGTQVETCLANTSPRVRVENDYQPPPPPHITSATAPDEVR